MDEPTEKRSPVLIRPPTPADEEAWQQLYRGYADFYGVPMSSEILSTTWSWLLDPEHPLEGLLAVQDDQPIGLAHFRPQPRSEEHTSELQSRGQLVCRPLLEKTNK